MSRLLGLALTVTDNSGRTNNVETTHALRRLRMTNERRLIGEKFQLPTSLDRSPVFRSPPVVTFTLLLTIGKNPFIINTDHSASLKPKADHLKRSCVYHNAWKNIPPYQITCGAGCGKHLTPLSVSMNFSLVHMDLHGYKRWFWVNSMVLVFKD